MMNKAAAVKARIAMKSGTGVLFWVVTGGGERVGRVGVTMGVPPPVTRVGDDVVVGGSVVPDERTMRMVTLSI